MKTNQGTSERSLLTVSEFLRCDIHNSHLRCPTRMRTRSKLAEVLYGKHIASLRSEVRGHVSTNALDDLPPLYVHSIQLTEKRR